VWRSRTAPSAIRIIEAEDLAKGLDRYAEGSHMPIVGYWTRQPDPWRYPSPALAEAIFAVTAAAPLATVGPARQQVDVAGGTLTSRVRLTVAGLAGDVVTEATLSRVGAPDELVVTPVSTRVEGSALPIADVVVPAGAALAAVRGGAPPAARVRVTACNDAVRVWRTVADDHVFVYVREA
jgi:hypothetical protein